MPNFVQNYPTGSTIYVTVERLEDGTIYTIALTDNGDGTHTGNMPSGAGLGQYICRVYKQLGASPNPDTDTLLYPGETRIWSGSEFNFEAAVDAALGTYRNTGLTFANLRMS